MSACPRRSFSEPEQPTTYLRPKGRVVLGERPLSSAARRSLSTQRNMTRSFNVLVNYWWLDVPDYFDSPSTSPAFRCARGPSEQGGPPPPFKRWTPPAPAAYGLRM
jgi:hypothetical protein